MDMKERDPALFDVGAHVVALNQLLTELNKVTRQTYKPDYASIDNLATDIKHHASMIQQLCDGLRGL
jgi:hypothetical protein